MFLELAEVAYMEVADSDERYHRPPVGWQLATIDFCDARASQIFRYTRSDDMAMAAS